MKLSNLPFSYVRRLLLDLDFTEKQPNSGRLFVHEPSDTVFVFRAYAPDEKIHMPDLFSLRKHLDERGLLAAETFDDLLKKVPA